MKTDPNTPTTHVKSDVELLLEEQARHRAAVRTSIQDDAAYWPAGATPEQRKQAEETLHELTERDCPSAELAMFSAAAANEPVSTIVTLPTNEAAEAYARGHIEPALDEKSSACLRIAALHASDPAREHLYAETCAKYSEKSVLAKMERLAERGLVEIGVSARLAWITHKGSLALLRHHYRPKAEAGPIVFDEVNEGDKPCE